MRKVNGLITLGLVIILGLLIMGLPVRAETTYATPDTYIITLYKTELSPDYGASWITVFNNAGGKSLDLKTNAGDAFSQQGTVIQPGTYNVIKFTILNTITASGTEISLYDSAEPAEPVEVYFAVSGTFTWNNDGSTLTEAFPLPDPIRVEAHAASKMIVNFGVTNALWSDDEETWHLKPPTLTVSNIVVPTTGILAHFQGGQYYYVRQDMRFPVEEVVTPTHLSVESGWGTISLSALTEGKGDFLIQAAEDNYHSYTFGNQGLEMSNDVTSNSEPIAGKYYVDSDGYVNMLMPRSSGIIRGALRSDGKVFAAIEIAAPSSQTTNTEIGYHMIYALKQENHTGNPYLDGCYVMNGYNHYVESAIDYDTQNPFPAGYVVHYKEGVGLVSGTSTAFTTAETSNDIRVEHPLSDTGQSVTNRGVECLGPQTNPVSITIQANGRWGNGQGGIGAVLADGYVGLIAGSENLIDKSWPELYGEGSIPITKTESDLMFGIALKPRPVPYWTQQGGHKAELVGSYTFVYKGDMKSDEDNILPSNNVMLGRIILKADGSVSGRVIECTRGEINIQDLSLSTWDVITANIGAITGTLNTDYIETEVIELSGVGIKMLIAYDGLTLAPYADPGIPDPLGHEHGLGTYNNMRGLGLAVKQ